MLRRETRIDFCVYYKANNISFYDVNMLSGWWRGMPGPLKVPIAYTRGAWLCSMRPWIVLNFDNGLVYGTNM